ncbi:unnamed protein product [Durusdinium trenchii]|uniref:Uncharacterized protein n=1 Tax=Durusdinium trenchii TaxID=1381693 RepID=A0ABP0LV56_9DINO
MFEYNNLQSQQAHVPSAIFKLHGLLEALLTASPTSQIKYRNLRDALESMVQKYGHELLSQHWTLEKHLLTGRAADSITVLLNHWRRCVASDTQWSKFISKLSHAQANVLTRLRKMTTSAPATCSKKVLKEHKSDVTMDSEGFPTMLQDEETSLELVHGEDETSDEPCCSIDEAAALREPPPVLKKDWKDAAGKWGRKQKSWADWVSEDEWEEDWEEESSDKKEDKREKWQKKPWENKSGSAKERSRWKWLSHQGGGTSSDATRLGALGESRVRRLRRREDERDQKLMDEMNALKEQHAQAMQAMQMMQQQQAWQNWQAWQQAQWSWGQYPQPQPWQTEVKPKEAEATNSKGDTSKAHQKSPNTEEDYTSSSSSSESSSPKGGALLA